MGGPAPLTVMYVGNFRPAHSTETHLARTLEQMGHTVLRVQEDATSPQLLTRRLTSEDTDLFLFTRTWGKTVEASHLALLAKRGVTSVSYHLDLYLGLKRDGGIDRDPFWRTDWVFTPDGDPSSQDEFERRGINHRWMPPGVVADECYLTADVPLEREVIFVGSGKPHEVDGYHPEYSYRGQLLGWLEDTYGSRYSHHGARGQSVRGAELNRMYASTRVAVGDSLVKGFTHKGYCSDRRYEAPGRGAFQIFPRIDGLNDGFVDGETIVEYDFGDFGGLKERIDHYLAHDGERERIRRAGHALVREHHTYTNRLTRMFEILRAEGALS